MAEIEKDLSGKEFEKAVASIQARMDPNSTVTHNETIIDKKGHSRQFDVVIRGKCAGRDLLGIIECKDWNKPVGNEVVDAFVTKTNNINANFRMIASRTGFTEPALESCKHEGIGAYSLLPNDPLKYGHFMGSEWYARLFAWTDYNLTVHIKPPFEKEIQFGLEDVKCRDLLVLDWFKKYLDIEFSKLKEEKVISVTLKFDQPVELSIKGEQLTSLGLSFSAKRISEVRKKVVQVTGDAFYDWTQGAMIVPPQGQVISGPFKADFSDWEKTSSEIPPSHGLGDFRLEVFLMHFSDEKEIVDLSKM